VYLHPLNVFWQFIMMYGDMPRDALAHTEIVSEIYCDLLRHAGRCIGMHHKCFSNLPHCTEACQEVYLHPPKLFR
jgi:hypothetical protein